MPTIYVIAGPNGIGKTTSSFDLLPKNIPLINSDEIAKEAREAGILSVNSQEYSNQEAAKLVNEHLNRRSSFIIETNLADVETWKFLISVQQLGYELNIKYISTDRLDLLNNRIAERVLLGDHYVRPDIVEQRYVTGLKLLDHYFEYPDVLELFDNSKTMLLVAEYRKGQQVMQYDHLPSWVVDYLGRHLSGTVGSDNSLQTLKDIDAVRKAYEKMKNQPNGEQGK
jgi:predicted ABC-type ATPase